MKHLATILFVLIAANFTFAQTEIHKQKFSTLEPDLWLGIWDQDNSDSRIPIQTIAYNDIPKYLDFRGTVVEALKWADGEGEKILVQTVTGHFNWKEYHSNSTEHSVNDKAELYVYLFTKAPGAKQFTKSWRIYDYVECFGVDWFAGFVPKATTVTDIDSDGLTEVNVPYALICRGDVSPGTMKMIMYEGRTKYALRGATMHCFGNNAYGGAYTPSPNLNNQTDFLQFLQKRWDIHKCENGRFY